jgi:hypothetical protein
METGINLLLVASIIYMILGVVHAYLTLFTDAMEPTNQEVLELNKTAHSKITKQTTLWSSSIGFHLSHSVGMFVFGLFYFVLANDYSALIASSVFFSLIIVLVPIFYLFLSIKYWFIVPTIGLGLSCVLFVLGTVFVNA